MATVKWFFQSPISPVIDSTVINYSYRYGSSV
jgi:hypothetical protein